MNIMIWICTACLDQSVPVLRIFTFKTVLTCWMKKNVWQCGSSSLSLSELHTLLYGLYEVQGTSDIEEFTCILSANSKKIDCQYIVYTSTLQEKVAKTACMSACKHIATSLKDFLLDNNVTQMTIPALMQFSLDLVQCEGKLRHIRILKGLEVLVKNSIQKVTCKPHEAEHWSVVMEFSIQFELQMSHLMTKPTKWLCAHQCPGWSVSSLGAQLFCWFCCVVAQTWIAFFFLHTKPCTTKQAQLSHVTIKLVSGVSDQVRLKPVTQLQKLGRGLKVWI